MNDGFFDSYLKDSRDFRNGRIDRRTLEDRHNRRVSRKNTTRVVYSVIGALTLYCGITGTINLACESVNYTVNKLFKEKPQMINYDQTRILMENK